MIYVVEFPINRPSKGWKAYDMADACHRQLREMERWDCDEARLLEDAMSEGLTGAPLVDAFEQAVGYDLQTKRVFYSTVDALTAIEDRYHIDARGDLIDLLVNEIERACPACGRTDARCDECGGFCDVCERGGDAADCEECEVCEEEEFLAERQRGCGDITLTEDDIRKVVEAVHADPVDRLLGEAVA